MRVLFLVVLAGCASQQRYTYKQPATAEKALPPVTARVVPAAEADASGLVPGALSIPFGGDTDGTALIERFLDGADQMRAHLITDLAIYLQTTRDERVVECRSRIVPETVQEQRVVPSHYEQVPVSKPVTRTVTEFERRCKQVTKYELRTRTEYQQKCGSVMKPVTRTRTAYRQQYDSFSKSYRSVPYTETYTAYESHYECKSEPVSRTKSEPVSQNECTSEPVTRTVTRHEFQFESRFVPARLELITRQRLRELDPECYAPSPGPPGFARRNRIEGRIFTQPARK